ncbi:MAG TPA: carboxypeptidase regulatory-like domain-containing protein [Chloroflexota bacterium]
MSDDLPSAWRLQAALLRSGLTARTVRTADIGELQDAPADVVVFDRGVPGTAAMAVLGRIRPPEGATVAPALFIVDDASGTPSVPGERWLVAPVADETLRRAVEELIRETPRPEPRVIPPLEEVDLTGVPEPPPIPTVRRRRGGLLGGAGPILALIALVGLLGLYGASVAGRVPRSDLATPSPSPAAGPSTPAPSLTAAPSAPAAASTAVAAARTAPPSGATPAVAARTTPATGVPPRPTVAATVAPPPTAGPSPPNALPAATAPSAAGSVPPATASAVSTVPPVAGAALPRPNRQAPNPGTGLEGRVTDTATGAAVPGAVVSYRGPANGETVAGGDGRYRVADLPAGAYTVAASAPGYAASNNRAGVVEGVVTTDNLALQASGAASVAPFESVVNRLTGQPAAVYGYRVNAGDTLRDVAERAGTNLAEILAVNRLDDPDHLEPGQVIYLPASTFGHK